MSNIWKAIEPFADVKGVETAKFFLQIDAMLKFWEGKVQLSIREGEIGRLD